MFLSLLSFAAVAAAQSAPGIASNPGGVIPAGIPQPNITGFNNPDILPARGGYAICVSGTTNVTVSAQNLQVNINLPQNQTQVTETAVELRAQSGPGQQPLASGMQTVSGTYTIGISMCMPANGTVSDTVQFLTHGVGFDRYYWDWAPGYSYADFAAVQGHASFFYDRLGVGVSSKPDPISVLQAPIQVEVAAALVRMLRAGQFGGITASKVVGVGHSYGSAITQGVTNKYPSLLDAAALTGFSINETGQAAFSAALNLAIASQNAPYRFSDLNSGFLVASTAISNQYAFFRSPGFDPMQLAQAEAQKQTVTFAEFVTTTATTKPATNFTGPVCVVNGDADLPFCDGNCTYPVNKAAEVLTLYPAAKNMTNNVYIVPDCGHGINLHYTATRAYQFIQNFITASGL